MKRAKWKITGVILVLLVFLLRGSMQVAYAAASPVLIVGLQTGSTVNASQEMIELANISGMPVDISTMRLEYFAGNPKSLTVPSRTIVLQGKLAAGAHYMLASTGYLQDQSAQSFSATLAAAGGHLKLMNGTTQLDLVGWGTAVAPLGQAAPAPPAGSTLVRKQDGNGDYTNSADNSTDFTVDGQQEAPLSSDFVAHISLSELLPDPASPSTDAKDEYIELYNAEDTTTSLTGYKLLAGPMLNKRFVFTDQTLAPGEYKAFYITQTELTLSNSGSRVQLQSPDGQVLDETSYEQALTGAAWAWDGNDWQWSSVPTPNTVNQIAEVSAKNVTASTAKKTTAKKAASKTTAKKAQVKGVSTTDGAVAKGQTAVVPESKLHPTIIAGVGSLAVLYAAYEYRHDVANFYQKLRRNRKAR